MVEELLKKHKGIVFSSEHFMPTKSMPCEVTVIKGMYGTKKYTHISEADAIKEYVSREPEY